MSHKKSKSPQADRNMVAIKQRQSFSGPIPPPQILAQYDQILPGAAERILKMAETQESHRHKIENQVINSGILNSRIGLVFGFLVGVIAIISGAIVAVLSGGIVGGFISVGGLASLVSVFVYGAKNRKEEREGKDS